MFQSHSNNPKPTPKAEFGSTPHKQLTRMRKNETRAEKIHFQKREKSES